jgi:glucose-6-phosphate 1-dehydrogenase
MAPEFFGTIAKHLKSEQIVDGQGFERLIIEKPFGTSLATAEKLNDELAAAFNEDQIYRIDHYLGKEMVQNIFAVRFANIIFEHIWNRDYIDNVQITFAESIGVEDRGGYYDHSGALKDMVQNHALQVLSLLAMDKPSSFKEEDVRAEKIRVFQHLRHLTDEELKQNFIRGQYAAGSIDGKDYVSYLDEPNIADGSQTETFASGVFFVDTDRFRDVPFFFRTGKRLTEKGTRVTITFKHAENIFGQPSEANVLTIYIQPTEGFMLSINGKEVGSTPASPTASGTNLINSFVFDIIFTSPSTLKCISKWEGNDTYSISDSVLGSGSYTGNIDLKLGYHVGGGSSGEVEIHHLNITYLG